MRIFNDNCYYSSKAIEPVVGEVLLSVIMASTAHTGAQ